MRWGDDGILDRNTSIQGVGSAPEAAVVLPDGIAVPSRIGARRAETPVRLRIRRRDAIFRRTVALADIAAFVLALVLGPILVGGADPTAWLLALPVALVGLIKAMGLYDRDENMLAKRTLTELPSLLGIASLATLGSWLAAPAILAGTYDRLSVVIFGLTFFALLIGGRTGAREIARRAAPAERCLLVGDGASVEELAEKLEGSRVVKADVLTVPALAVALEGNGGSESSRPGSLDAPGPTEIETLIESERIERVVLTVDLIESGDVLEVTRKLQARGVRVSLLPQTSRVPGSAVDLDQVDGLNLYGVKPCEITRSSQVLKRSLDLAVSLGGLLLLAPFLAAIAVAIKLSSRGGVIYRQVRIGRAGESFSILKFRTMVEGAHARRASLDAQNAAAGLFKVVDDPRLTRVGRWLRRSSLDELPQLVNVLRGEMSLVGPRPLVPEEDCLVIGRYRARLDVSPGMTGHWQVLGSWRVPLEEMVKLDHQYVANWSLWGDLELLLRTLGHVLRRRGT